MVRHLATTQSTRAYVTLGKATHPYVMMIHNWNNVINGVTLGLYVCTSFILVMAGCVGLYVLFINRKRVSLRGRRSESARWKFGVGLAARDGASRPPTLSRAHKETLHGRSATFNDLMFLMSTCRRMCVDQIPVYLQRVLEVPARTSRIVLLTPTQNT